MAEEVKYIGTGRRKNATARVILTPGSGTFIVNDRPLNDYIPSASTRLDIFQPLELTENTKTFDIQVNVDGGGITGQAGAIRHGLARALVQVNADYRTPLKRAGLITRDPRAKERKKYGLRKARRAPQFSKR